MLPPEERGELGTRGRAQGGQKAEPPRRAEGFLVPSGGPAPEAPDG